MTLEVEFHRKALPLLKKFSRENSPQMSLFYAGLRVPGL